MIKKYEDVKVFVDRMISSHYLNAAVVIDEIFTEEFNAIDVRIICSKDGFEITDDSYFKFKHRIKKEFGDLIISFELVETPFNDTSLIIYLENIDKIRSHKIKRIKSNLIQETYLSI
jgi:hypothetical protein